MQLDVKLARVLVKFRSGLRAGQSEVFVLDRQASIYIGRDPNCDLRFDLHREVVVSRNHAVIECSRGPKLVFTVADLLSTNGTYLNGRRISAPTPLSAGDRLQFGKRGPEIEVDFDLVSMPLVASASASPRTQPLPVLDPCSTLDGDRCRTGQQTLSGDQP